MLAVFAASFLNAQQFSFEKNNHYFSIIRYTFPNHLGIKKVYSISQNNLGIIFFSTDRGIISFDGLEWGVVNFNEKSFLAQVNDQLLLFSKNFIASIDKDETGLYTLHSMTTTFLEKEWQPSAIISGRDSAFIIAGNKLWLYRNNTLRILADSMDSARLFSRSGEVLLQNKESFYSIRQGKLLPLNDKKNIAPTGNMNGSRSFLVTRGKNEVLMELGEPGLERVILPIQDTVVTTHADKNDNLWLISQKALYCVKYAGYFNLLKKLPISDNAMVGFAHHPSGYYFASTNTLFYPPGHQYNLKGETAINIFSLGEKIIVAKSNGIFLFSKNQLIPVVSRPVTYVTKNRDKIVFVSKGSLYSLRYINGEASVKEILNLKGCSIARISFATNGEMFILDRKSRVIALKPEEKGFVQHILYESSLANSPVLENIFRIDGDIYVCNAFNIYKLEGNMLKNQEKSAIDFPARGHFVEFLAEDTAGGILYSTSKPGDKKHIYYGKKSGSDRINWLEIPIWEAGMDNPTILGSSGQEIVFYQNGSLIKLDLDNFFARRERLVITVHEIFVDNQPLSLQKRKKGHETVHYFEAQYPVNLISLKFYASDLTYPDHIRYSFQMVDKDAGWSAWSSLPEQNFSNLPPGEYQLLVKAQTINGSISEPYKILFKIHSPIYLQWFAWIFYCTAFLGLIAYYGLRRKKQFEREKIKLEKIIQERTSELMREKEKTDELIANMLPKDTADEIKNTGKASSHKFDMATVLFSDIQGFTKIAEQMNPEKLIDELDNFFFQFDSVVEKYNIEKIKTIGDAYMAAGGIPYKNRTNPVEVVLAAVEMQEYMKTLKKKNTNIWDLRIGIHTGAVIAGVVGHKRISYDIWGDTVNTASRMESSGEAGKINISGQTYELVKEFFICEYRGKMPVKYKGDIDMYFVKGIRPELSVNLRTIPNKKFFIQLQLLRIQDLEEFVFDKLENELPRNLPFHNLKHTKDVYTQAELLGRAENISPEEMLLLRTAALMHDTGYIWAYYNHELKSIEFCREILPKFKYTPEQIDLVCELISYTRLNARPQHKLEKILADSNTDFYGRIDFLQMLIVLAKELQMNYSRNESDMLREQLTLLENHEYYTHTARKLREVSKDEQIRKVKEYLKEK